MTRLLILLSMFIFLSGGLDTYAQKKKRKGGPPKSYKKQLKRKAKEGQSSDDLMKDALAASKVLKKFKDKLAKLGKDKQDAEADGDPVKIGKIDHETRVVKGEMFRARDKIEKKMIKNYQKINDKQTRKRMKKNKKKSGRLNAGKKPSLWKRLFK